MYRSAVDRTWDFIRQLMLPDINIYYYIILLNKNIVGFCFLMITKQISVTNLCINEENCSKKNAVIILCGISQNIQV